MAQRTRRPFIPKMIANYLVSEIISQSPEGVVVKAFDEKENTPVVIKIVNNRINPFELFTLRTLDHPKIVKCLEAFNASGFTYIVLEFVEEGDLSKYLASQKILTEEEARMFFGQIVEAVQYLHLEKQLVHRDLKPENVLVKSDHSIRLCDFAFAAPISPTASHKEWLGSVDYCSPEIATMTPYSGPEVDVWALGVMLFELVSGDIPYSNLNFAKRKSLPSTLSSECCHLIDSMLCLDPGLRFNIEQIAQHPWLCCDLNSGGEKSTLESSISDCSIDNLLVSSSNSSEDEPEQFPTIQLNSVERRI